MSLLKGQKVVVCLELGHICNVKEHIWTNPGYTTKSFDEATHDWEFFIRDVHKGDMKQYTDKIIVNLHETFKNPRRVLKEPPFVVKEQGYAGFTIFIDIFFKDVPDGDEFKKYRINYDLDLTPSMQDLSSDPARRTVQREKRILLVQKLTIFNKNSNFIKSLLKGGGRLVDEKAGPQLTGSSFSKGPAKPISKTLSPIPLSTSSSNSSLKTKESGRKRSRSRDRSNNVKRVEDKRDRDKSNKSSHKDKDREKDKSKEKEKEAKTDDKKSVQSKEPLKSRASEAFKNLFGEPIQKNESLKKDVQRSSSSKSKMGSKQEPAASSRPDSKEKLSKAIHREKSKEKEREKEKDKEREKEKERKKEKEREKEKEKEKEREKRKREEKKQKEAASVAEKLRREKEEKDKLEKERLEKEKLERDRKEKEERERKEKKRREEEARKEREEAERQQRLELERQRQREEGERKMREEQERRQKEKEREEAEKKKKEEKDKNRRKPKGLMAGILKNKEKNEKNLSVKTGEDDSNSKPKKSKKKKKEKDKKKKKKKHSKRSRSTSSESEPVASRVHVSSESETRSASSSPVRQIKVSQSRSRSVSRSISRSTSPSPAPSPAKSSSRSRSSSSSPVRWVSSLNKESDLKKSQRCSSDSESSSPPPQTSRLPMASSSQGRISSSLARSKEFPTAKKKIARKPLAKEELSATSDSDGDPPKPFETTRRVLSDEKPSPPKQEPFSPLKSSQQRSRGTKRHLTPKEEPTSSDDDFRDRENNRVIRSPKRLTSAKKEDLSVYPVQAQHKGYPPLSEFSVGRLEVLQQVQDRIANPRKGDNVDSIVRLIQGTGCFQVENDNFIFDLCLLDERTVRKITKVLGIKIKVK